MRFERSPDIGFLLGPNHSCTTESRDMHYSAYEFNLPELATAAIQFQVVPLRWYNAPDVPPVTECEATRLGSKMDHGFGPDRLLSGMQQP